MRRALPYILAFAALALASGAPMAREAPIPREPQDITLGAFFRMDHAALESYAPLLMARTIARGEGCPALEREHPITPVWRFRQDKVRWLWMAQRFKDGGEPPEAREALWPHWVAFVREWCRERRGFQ